MVDLHPKFDMFLRGSPNLPGQGTEGLQEDLENAQDLRTKVNFRGGLVKIIDLQGMIKNWGEFFQPVNLELEE